MYAALYMNSFDMPLNATPQRASSGLKSFCPLVCVASKYGESVHACAGMNGNGVWNLPTCSEFVPPKSPFHESQTCSVCPISPESMMCCSAYHVKFLPAKPPPSSDRSPTCVKPFWSDVPSTESTYRRTPIGKA